MWEALTVCKGNLSKLEAKNDNLRNDIEIMNIFRMYSFESTIPTNSSLRPNMNPIRAVLRCIGPYKNNTYDLILLPELLILGRPGATKTHRKTTRQVSKGEDDIVSVVRSRRLKHMSRISSQ